LYFKRNKTIIVDDDVFARSSSIDMIYCYVRYSRNMTNGLILIKENKNFKETKGILYHEYQHHFQCETKMKLLSYVSTTQKNAEHSRKIVHTLLTDYSEANAEIFSMSKIKTPSNTSLLSHIKKALKHPQEYYNTRCVNLWKDYTKFQKRNNMIVFGDERPNYLSHEED
jgi:hypothetical protein